MTTVDESRTMHIACRHRFGGIVAPNAVRGAQNTHGLRTCLFFVHRMVGKEIAFLTLILSASFCACARALALKSGGKFGSGHTIRSNRELALAAYKMMEDLGIM